MEIYFDCLEDEQYFSVLGQTRNARRYCFGFLKFRKSKFICAAVQIRGLWAVEEKLFSKGWARFWT